MSGALPGIAITQFNVSILKRVTSRVARFLCYLIFSFYLTPTHSQPANTAQALTEIQNLARTGATDLALDTVRAMQPAPEAGIEDWMRWERERIALLNMTQEYKRLSQRLAKLPEGLPEAFMLWAVTQQASAYLQNQQFARARQVLLQVIWGPHHDKEAFENKWLPQWRRMIIHSYLGENNLKDAYTAIARFRQDYGEGDLNDVVLYARVLLMNEQTEEALSVLARHTQHPEAGMLSLLAHLRSNKRNPRKVLQAGLRQMQGEWVKPELKLYLWAIVAEAAQRSHDLISAIKALEHVFSGDHARILPEGLFDLDPDVLWQSYIDHAQNIGNKAQYLIGDDKVWFNAAQATQAVDARALYAMLIIRGQEQKYRELAAQHFLQLLVKNNNADSLIKALFLNSKYFPAKANIPLSIRRYLVDVAINNMDIDLASQLMTSIKKPPQGADSYMWHLRRSRILIMGGEHQEGADSLLALLRETKTFSIEQMDRLMQVIFDLQTVSAHAQAIALFTKLLERIDDTQRKREIYYWMADSRKAQNNFVEAARLYLKSAMFNDPDAMDPWAQTAYYQAAGALTKAGLINDARAIYKKLLAVTQDTSRRSMLQHELQQLWLLETK